MTAKKTNAQGVNLLLVAQGRVFINGEGVLIRAGVLNNKQMSLSGKHLLGIGLKSRNGIPNIL